MTQYSYCPRCMRYGPFNFDEDTCRFCGYTGEAVADARVDPLLEQWQKNPPAFPVVPDKGAAWFGMTMHDWFVGQVLAGVTSDTENLTPQQWKELAFEVADLVMAERKRRAEHEQGE